MIFGFVEGRRSYRGTKSAPNTPYPMVGSAEPSCTKGWSICIDGSHRRAMQHAEPFRHSMSNQRINWTLMNAAIGAELEGRRLAAPKSWMPTHAEGQGEEELCLSSCQLPTG